ncbi:MAG: glycosyltransferase family 9 protein [Bdellovibrionaceae bacterium]|nr:glycosyltransferase family 9 protein [Pseudobdellovibrionaceae bacterium]NUM59430.1 glycosyltransferase family 9 protein [Pseudobdellovibrionaceae bacterium]
MKVLFLSLLRIGDLLMHIRLLEGYRQQNPKAEIHILVYDLIPYEFCKLFPWIEFHYFYRYTMQKQINSFEQPLLYPLLHGKKIITQLNEMNFDKVIDLTYQKFSAKILSLLSSPYKVGVYNWDQFESHNNDLNLKFITQMLDPHNDIHYLDLLKKLLKVNIDIHSASINNHDLVLFQIQTSDSKKNLDLIKWKKTLELLKEKFPTKKFKILLGKDDFKKMTFYFAKSDMLVANFHESKRLLEESNLLVTLDTSIKHLAVYSRTPTLEISVGSSHPKKTSGYQEGNFILSSNSECRPCSHHSACQFERNLCQDMITEKSIYDFVSFWLEKKQLCNQFTFKTLVSEKNLKFQKGDLWIKKKSKEICI